MIYGRTDSQTDGHDVSIWVPFFGYGTLKIIRKIDLLI